MSISDGLLSDYSPFTHVSINWCDEFDTHNAVIDYDASVTGTAGITDHPLSEIANHDFETYWQADPAVADDDQYFAIELSAAVYCNSYIVNSHKPQNYTVSPYTPHPNCWKAWTLKGKLNAGDAWTTLETVAANDLKFYRGTFTRGQYKYFRVESITAYDDVAQSSRIDAYLYNLGIFDSTDKYNDTFPDTRRGRNDVNSNPETDSFSGYDVYIDHIHMIVSDVCCMNGVLSKYVKGERTRKYRHFSGLWSDFADDVLDVTHPEILKLTRLNSIDFVTNSGICLYMFPPPDELWYFLNSSYTFDETTANMNTPIKLKVPDNSCKISPTYTTTREYTSYAVLGSRYKDAQSGEFKVNKFFIAFSDYMNMETQVHFHGQSCEGLITDMDGTALLGATNANSSVNVARLKIGDVWRGRAATLDFDPPIKLDGNVPTDLFEFRKSEKIMGSVFRYVLHGFKVPKEAT